MTIWLFNLDADVELATGKGYAPSRAVMAAMVAPRQRLARELAQPGDGLVVEDAGGARVVSAHDESLARERLTRFPRSGEARSDALGRAFCPTPRAITLFRKLGVEPEPHPPVDVLRRVNSRAFCADLGHNLSGSLFARTVDEAVSRLATAPPIGKQWRAKRAHGMAGRGQRPIAPGHVSDADLAYLRASIERDGGIQLEPEVDIVRELATHGMLASDGTLRMGTLVEQRCDATGQWLSSSALEDESLASALRNELARVARALHDAGYFGPFGIDAYEYRVDNEIRLNPRSEINARYSMGFAASGLA